MSDDLPTTTQPRDSGLAAQDWPLMQALLSKHPEVIYVTDPHTYEVLFVNDAFAEALESNPAGKKCYKEFQGLDTPCPFCTNEQLLRDGKDVVWEHTNPITGRTYKITDQLIRWRDNRLVRFELATDVTGLRQTERELQDRTEKLSDALAERDQLLAEMDARVRRQANELLELSTPVLALARGVVLAPLLGALDSYRVQRFMERLLTTVSDSGAQVAIIDITGVPTVDTQTAQHLIDAARAVALLGGRVVLTGIRPRIAQTLVQLGVDLGGIVTRASLADGLDVALEMVCNEDSATEV